MEVTTLAWTRTSFQILERMVHFLFSFMTQRIYSVPSVKSVSDLLVCIHEPLKFNIKVAILSLQHIAVIMQCVDFCADIIVSSLHGLICKSKIVKFATSHTKCLFTLVTLGIKIVHIVC
jgi:hypothetical protein